MDTYNNYDKNTSFVHNHFVLNQRDHSKKFFKKCNKKKRIDSVQKNIDFFKGETILGNILILEVLHVHNI